MRKPKVACFRYRRYNSVYVSSVSFSTNALLLILDAFFPEKKILVLIETDTKDVQTLSSVGKSIGIADVLSCSRASMFSVVCNKAELLCLLNHIDLDNMEWMFIVSINNDPIPEKFIRSLENTANSMVKNGISDISVDIIFPENEMEISLSKEKYNLVSFKDKIRSIFAD